MDRGRKDKKVSNAVWKSPIDSDSRITKIKDGRTHLAYKAEHAVDLETEAIVAAQVTTAGRGDVQTGPETVVLARVSLLTAGNEGELREVVAD